MSNRFPSLRAVLFLAYLCAAPTVAMAYIDPGNGAYMVQALLTLLGAALFYVRHPIRTAKMIWRNLRGRGAEEEAGTDSDVSAK